MTTIQGIFYMIGVAWSVACGVFGILLIWLFIAYRIASKNIKRFNKKFFENLKKTEPGDE